MNSRSALLLLILMVGIVCAWGQVRGIDVSKYQGTINWEKVAESKKVKYVYIKATEGASLKDPMYKKNLKGARDEGLPVGSYHLYSSKTTAYQQMDNFKAVVNKKQQDLIPVLDIEEHHSYNLNIARVDKILEIMEKTYGVKPIIYTSEHVYDMHFKGKKYANYKFFIANYRRTPQVPYTLWQYSQTGKVAGISGYVDFSELHPKTKLSMLKLPKKTDKE
ncbi:MAG: glycosyl hydrolase family 25 [Bacteroidales bacterium]|nr:glycosyl hydrolase family 25 [Bacteroidales bacterium]